MTTVLTVAFPVFAVIAAGYLAGRFHLASADDAAALNRFVFRFGFPAALFALMSSATGFGPADAAIALSYGGAALAVMTASYVIARIIFSLSPEDAGAHAFASTIGNAVFLGLPIALGIEGWARPFVGLMLVEGILVIGLGAALMAPRSKAHGAPLHQRIGAVIARPLKNPLVAAALAGFVFSALGLSLPVPVRSFFEILGRAAGPVALFSLGLFFATRAFPPLRETAGKTFAIMAMKMAAMPALAFALLSLAAPVDDAHRGALALFTFVPTAVGAYVMASQYGRYVDETATAIAATTALSVVSITAVLVAFT
ncbi:MAG: AEC family transporter [Parvularculaceae bacterium]|nr:AEC family transporter [Parvularculaceae bacterium]